MALWGARFSQDTHELVGKLTESISFDRRLYAHDVRASVAHVKMLAHTRIIPEADATAVVAELERIGAEIEGGQLELLESLEDIHMNIESRLIERLGDAGARVHTGRSRNDQVATDLRLYLRDEIDATDALLASMQQSLVTTAAANSEAVMPGLTHLQHAQPVLFAHHLLAYVEMLDRDRERLADCRRRTNRSPLGAGALAGSTLPLDREFTASELGFDDVMRNSMDAVADRDFAAELLAALAVLAMHLSRLSEDLIFWQSGEAGFVELADEFCTGSSLMPQKKNPDIAELTRGKCGRVYGALISLLTTMKGLPLCYNRDMQEDKEQLFDAIDTVKTVLAVYAPMMGSLQVNAERMRQAAADPALMATDLAEWLVRQGVPFRQAYERVGKFVGWCREQGVAMDQATLEQMQESIPEAQAECLELFSPEKSVAARDILGGTAPAQVAKQLEFWQQRLA